MQLVCGKNCLEHEWARLWYEVTGDSFVVDARQIAGADGAARYMTKYLVKGMMTWDELSELGFMRRWSTSRNWPKLPPERLLNELWDDVKWWKGDASTRDWLGQKVKETEHHPLTERVDYTRYTARMEKVNKFKLGMLGDLYENLREKGKLQSSNGGY